MNLTSQHPQHIDTRLRLVGQHPQFLDTLTLVRALKRLDHKLRGGKACRQAEKCAEWIQQELERRVAAARTLHGLSPETL